MTLDQCYPARQLVLLVIGDCSCALKSYLNRKQIYQFISTLGKNHESWCTALQCYWKHFSVYSVNLRVDNMIVNWTLNHIKTTWFCYNGWYPLRNRNQFYAVINRLLGYHVRWTRCSEWGLSPRSRQKWLNIIF